ncbi:MAG: DUF4339 domain-containing protein [Planctomycetaceae bacterium]|jgi:hypothetical protein|nr:DUF4339 domain-containing protein [Planctomycetaceae bacterium]
MVDIQNSRWVTPDNVFASRVTLPNLNNVFEPKGFFRWLAKEAGVESIVIEPGTIAYFVEEGQQVGHLPPGQHTMQGVLDCLKFWKIKQATVILTRGEVQHIDIDLADIPTREGLLIDARIRVSIQISNVAYFLANYMGAKDEISFENIRSDMLPLITQAAKQAIRLRTPEELQSGQVAESLSATISEQLAVRLKRYGMAFIETETLDISHQALDSLHEKRGEIWLGEQHIQDNLRRLKVNSELRDQHLSGAIDKIETKEEYAEFIAEVDKDALIRQEDVEELTFEFDNRKSDRESLRAHMIGLLDGKREFELESLNAEFEYQTDLTALNREIELAGVSHTKDSAAMIQMLELRKTDRAANREKQREDWGLWRDKQDVKRDESWAQVLHERQLQDVETEIAVGVIERDSRVALIEDELQNQLENSKLIREQRRKEWELEIEDQESVSQMDRLKAVQEMNAKFLADEARLRSELEELKLDKSSQRQLDKIASLKGSSTETLVALADTENARLLANMKTSEAVIQAKQDASEQLAQAAEDKSAAVAEALKDAMQVQKDVISSITGNDSQANTSNAIPAPPPAVAVGTATWFLARDGQTHGPYQHEQFIEFAKNGTVTADCQVQKAGANQWTRAGDCPELSIMFGGIVPPPPPPSAP